MATKKNIEGPATPLPPQGDPPDPGIVQGGLPRTEAGLDNSAILKDIAARIQSTTPGLPGPSEVPQPPPLTRGQQFAAGLVAGLSPEGLKALEPFNRQREAEAQRQERAKELAAIQSERATGHLEWLYSAAASDKAKADALALDQQRLAIEQKRADIEAKNDALSEKEHNLSLQFAGEQVTADLDGFTQNSEQIRSEAEALIANPATRGLGLELRSQHDAVAAAAHGIMQNPDAAKSLEVLKNVSARVAKLNETLAQSSAFTEEMRHNLGLENIAQLRTTTRTRPLPQRLSTDINDGMTSIKNLGEALNYFRENKANIAQYPGSGLNPQRFRTAESNTFSAMLQYPQAIVRHLLFGGQLTAGEAVIARQFLSAYGQPEAVIEAMVPAVMQMIANKTAISLKNAQNHGYDVAQDMEDFQALLQNADPGTQAVGKAHPRMQDGNVMLGDFGDNDPRKIYNDPDMGYMVDDPTMDDDPDLTAAQQNKVEDWTPVIHQARQLEMAGRKDDLEKLLFSMSPKDAAMVILKGKIKFDSGKPQEPLTDLMRDMQREAP